MKEELKSIKQYAREAKKRLKQGFWQNYNNTLNNEIERAQLSGISTSQVKEYYASRITEDIRNTKNEFEDFYLKVKKLVDEEGELPNAIGRLTDKEYFDSLSYEDKQRYTLNLSEQYLKAIERYRKEKSLGIQFFMAL